VPQARRIVEEMKRQRVTHVVGVPDNTSKALFEALHEEPTLRVLSVTREGEAFAIAAGLWAGGASPLVLIQNTGLLESGDAIRGTAMRMRIPLVCLVTYRGYAGLSKAGNLGAIDGPLLGRNELDSTAVLTEPTLTAWGLPFSFVHGDADLSRFTQAFGAARAQEQPVAVLLTRPTT